MEYKVQWKHDEQNNSIISKKAKNNEELKRELEKYEVTQKNYVELFGNKYGILSPEQIFIEMKNIIDDVRTILIHNPETIRQLLIQFNWNKTRLMETYFEDTNKIFKDSNLPKLVVSSGLYESLDLLEKECGICKEVKAPGDMLAMLCGHTYCKSCWDLHLAHKINEQNTFGPYKDLVCPSDRCTIILEEPAIRKYVGNKMIVQKYHNLMTLNFVDCHPNIRRCPQFGCTNSAWIYNQEWGRITCFCGNTFCSLCNEDWHVPINCEMLKLWKTKYLEVMKAHEHWIIQTRMNCPKCKIQHEKITGCNYIKCKCQIWFCWFCGKEVNLKEEKNLCKCNFYILKPGTLIYIQTMRIKHFYYRFKQYTDSLQKENGLKEIAQKIADDELVKIMSPEIAQIIVKCVETLCRARQVQIYIQVFSFYLTSPAGGGSKAKAIDDIEKCHRNLAAEIESASYNVGSSIMNNSKLQITQRRLYELFHRCNNCEILILNHADQICEGYLKNHWTFT